MGIPFLPAYDINEAGGVVALILCLAAVGLSIHLAARSLMKKDDLHRAFVAATLGILLAQLAHSLVEERFWVVGVLLAVVAFVLAIAVVYGAKPQAAVSVGAVSWVLWILASLSLTYVQEHWRP